MYNRHAGMMSILGVTFQKLSIIRSIIDCRGWSGTKRFQRSSFSSELARCSSSSSGVSLMSGGSFNLDNRRKLANSDISADNRMADGLSLSDSSYAQMCASGAEGTIQLSHPCWWFLHGADIHSTGWFPFKSAKFCNESLHSST